MGKPFVKGDPRINAKGRPKGSRTLLKHDAALILAGIDEVEHWRALLCDRDHRIRLDALKYLTDRRDGKAQQAINVDASQTCVLTLAGLPETEP